MANTLPTPFVWGDISLSEVVHIDGIPHTTRRAIGEWAEYADPQKAIDKILERNPHIEAHGIPVKLTGMDGARDYETTVYHPIGFLLIVFESGQPKAHAMKAAVAEFVWHYASPRKLSERGETDLRKLFRQLAIDVSAAKDAFTQQILLSELRDLSLALGKGLPDIALLGTDAKQLRLKGV